MLKKMTAVILIICILLTGIIVFADGSTPAGSGTKLTARPRLPKTDLAEIKAMLAQVHSNQTLFAQLRTDSKTAYLKAKKQIKKLIASKEDLTPEQMESLKQAADTLTKDKQLIAGTLGNIAKECPKLAKAKTQKDLAAYKQALNNILTIQNTRINNLKKVIDDMNKIMEI